MKTQRAVDHRAVLLGCALMAACRTGFCQESRLESTRQRWNEYAPGNDTVVDGAVFGLFMDWDPEIILVIEARATSDGARWHYGAGRFSDKPLRLQHQGADVWSHPGLDYGDPNGVFYSYRAGPHTLPPARD